MPAVVRKAGPMLLPVDAGRRGGRSRGIPPGGAADRGSLALANALVGNPPDTPALEFALLGPTLRTDQPLRLALVGAPFRIECQGVPIPPGSAFTLPAGGQLQIGGTPHRMRGYLAVAGGWHFSTTWQSVTTWQPLTDQTELIPRGNDQLIAPVRGYPFPSWDVWEAGATVPLRVLPGPQADWFDDCEAITHSPYRVGASSNRMGVRLVGEPLTRRAGELTSEPVDVGAVQITNDGQPVILGVDGPTIGGYPKIAHVIQADRDALGQLRPGDGVRFVPVTEREALQAYQERAAQLREWCLRARMR